jgi:hypothetical protein
MAFRGQELAGWGIEYRIAVQSWGSVMDRIGGCKKFYNPQFSQRGRPWNWIAIAFLTRDDICYGPAADRGERTREARKIRQPHKNASVTNPFYFFIFNRA